MIVFNISHPGIAFGYFLGRGTPQITLLGKTSLEEVLPAGLLFSSILCTVIIV